MLKAIRNIRVGSGLLGLGMVFIVTGLTMTQGLRGEKTLLCLEIGCVYIQGASNVVLGLLSIVVGIIMLLKKRVVRPSK